MPCIFILAFCFLVALVCFEKPLRASFTYALDAFPPNKPCVKYLNNYYKQIGSFDAHFWLTSYFVYSVTYVSIGLKSITAGAKLKDAVASKIEQLLHIIGIIMQLALSELWYHFGAIIIAGERRKNNGSNSTGKK